MTCRGCKYWRPLSSEKNGYYACHYMIDTGHIRGCDLSECDKRETGRRQKKWCSTEGVSR